MERTFRIVVLGGALCFRVSVTNAPAQQTPSHQSAVALEASPGSLPALPTLPRGKSTVVGGAIQSVDPVRDRLTLRVYGTKPMKILFDERTEVYRDGSRIPLHDLAAADHASVQTILDGTDVFAISIHILTRSPEGEYEGRIVSYERATGELVIDGGSAGQPFKLLVTSATAITRQGQPGFTAQHSGVSDLERGTLVSVKFESDKQSRGVASEVAILATPGSEFVFTGDIYSLDMQAASLVLVDARDDRTYKIFFDPARISASRDLHVGEHLRVTVGYDGTRYTASEIAAN